MEFINFLTYIFILSVVSNFFQISNYFIFFILFSVNQTFKILLAYSQKCNYDNNLFTKNGSYTIKQNSQIGVCMQSVIISAYTNKVILFIIKGLFSNRLTLK